MHVEMDFAIDGTIQLVIYNASGACHVMIGYANWWEAYALAKRIQTRQRID
jgi:hypothetical protein